MLFGWQTWQLVNFLFPAEDIFMMLLTLLSFDIMAAFWTIVHSFYSFHSRGAKQWVTAGWVITFFLSFVASVLYLSIRSFFRFHLTISTDTVNFGYGVSIFALTFNILVLMAWLLLEWKAVHPHLDAFDILEQQENNSMQGNNRQYGNTGQLLQIPRTLGNTGQARTRNTKQRTAALAIINKYGKEAILSDPQRFAQEAGVSPRTVKRYANQ